MSKGARYRTYSDYRQAWNQAFHADPPVPLNIDIELASLCNLACPFCAWGDKLDFIPYMQGTADDGNPRRRFMPVHMARALIDECAALGVPALKFNFRGEATLHPQFSDIVIYAAAMFHSSEGALIPSAVNRFGDETRAFHDLLVNTNGNVPPAALDGLMACTKVMVSLDTLVAETYEQMRVRGDLGKAIETVKELLRRGHQNVWIRRVITKQNQSEPFVAEAKATFGPAVHISEHYAFDRSPNELMLADKDGTWARTYCGYPSQRLVVTTTGKVLACCVSWRDEVAVGDWPEQTLVSIWKSQRLADLRAALRADAYEKAPALCQNCTSFMSYRRAERDQVQDREAV